MDKITIGIPRALPYYYLGNFWKYFWKKCDIDVVYSPNTNEEILTLGKNISPTEMCLSMKIYLGHLSYLDGKCDYLLVPRIDRYDDQNQTCTNFLALYDLAAHYVETPILNYNIDSHQDLLDGVLELGSQLSIPKMQVLKAYEYALKKDEKWKKMRALEQQRQLQEEGKKVLIVSHAYNIHDTFIGGNILKLLKEKEMKVFFSDYFDSTKTALQARKLSKKLYWKYSRESIGAIPLCKKVDGIIFVSTFPCGLDSLVHELVMRKLEKPYLNLVIDDLSSDTGIETRIESFVDLLEQS